MTTSELAAMLGLSRATVSRVLNNHSNVKPETRLLVENALKKYNYTPNETARSLVMSRSLRIAVIVFSEPAFFWQQVEHGVNSAWQDLKPRGVTVDYFVTNILKPLEQLELLQTLPSQGYDGIVIAPNDIALLSSEVNRLSNGGYPVVVINVEMPTANQLCYIGCDYTRAGALAAELLAKFLGGQGEVLLLTLDTPVSPIEQRVRGFRKELAQYSGISIQQVSRFNRKAEGVYKNVRDVLAGKPSITGIFSSIAALEPIAQACIDAKRPDIAVVGYDLNEEIYQYLKSGAISATICHEPFSQGYYSVKTLHRYLDKSVRPASSVLYTKLEAIVKSNALYYLNEQMLLQIAQE